MIRSSFKLLAMTAWTVGAAAALPLHAQQPNVQPSRFNRAPMIQPPPPGEIEILPIRGNLYALFGAGGNIVASVGADGVLLVDTGLPDMTDKILDAVGRLQREWQLRNPPKPLGWGAETRSSVADRQIVAPPKPIRYIINTHGHPDHVGGNEKLRNSGKTFTGGNVAGDIRDSGEGAAILAHENVLLRMSQGGEGQPAALFDALPTDSYFVEYYKLSHFFNGEGIQLFHAPKAHTDGDSLVHFRGTDVIALGDLMSTDAYPMVDIGRGGNINGIIDGLNRVLDMAVAEFRLEGGTMMVPGHGRLVDSGDVAYYRDMLTIIRDRVQDLVKKRMTLDQVKAARPTADYDTEYGATSGHWTTDQFVEAVYKSLGGGESARAGAPGAGKDAVTAIMTTPKSQLPNPKSQTGFRRAFGFGRLLGVGIWVLGFGISAAGAQQGRGAAAPAPTPRASAPIDLTGQWVSLVTDDWRWRMVTPPKGDVLHVPVNDAGRRAAEQWDPSRDEAAGEACRAYGAGGIMHAPGRLRIGWDGETTLKVETDTGQQTRLFNFGNTPAPAGEPTWQGFSLAAWELPGGGGGRGRGGRAAGPATRPGSSLRVVTTRMRPGYYRKNGVPYGANATMTEWFTTVAEPDGNTYLLVTKILEDPQYLSAPYVRTVQFKKQNDTSGWNPTPCSAR